MIWLLRHGDAESRDGSTVSDSERKLTGKGEGQSERAGLALAALGAKVDVCISSPKARALDTAKLACQALGVEPEVDNRLAGGDFDAEELAAGRGEVLLVGHEPDFSRAIGRLTGARVKLRKGGVGAIEEGTLMLLLAPPELKAIGLGTKSR